MEYSVTNMFAQKMTENVYVKAFAQGEETEQRELPPVVSVLLASYNHEKYVEAAVRSVMEQKGVAFELIVLDDGSKDKSPEILKKLSAELKFRYIHRENKGVVATLNEMLELARGKYFCTFSSDDIMPPDRLKKQSDCLMAHPEAAGCFGQVKPMSENGIVSENLDPAFLKSVPEIKFEEFFLGLKPLHGCAEMFVTEKVRRLGGYDTRFFFEDYPLYLKVLYEYGPQPVLPDIVCCHYRDHGNNMHANHNRMYAEFLRIIELYKDHKLYPQAVKNWKANWFSALAYAQKGEALKRLPQLATFSSAFFKRLPKLFIPRMFLKY
ncbi:glycosyltransferase [Fibrobacter succinogenes]|uniref:glycosyltransferase family 2 protein n=1 Tax=Fibrobacter succinogenes TaxID=833 RepID=UPI0025DE93D4|nr:glycosyltransferase [Fibrobacter succinogenes]